MEDLDRREANAFNRQRIQEADGVCGEAVEPAGQQLRAQRAKETAAEALAGGVGPKQVAGFTVEFRDGASVKFDWDNFMELAVEDSESSLAHNIDAHPAVDFSIDTMGE